MRYAFSGNPEDLKFAYPIMKGAVVCYLDLLIEEPKNKWLVTAPSNSPENKFYTPEGEAASTCMGPTMDLQILRELFGNFIQASRELKLDEPLRQRVEKARARLAPNQIGPDDRLQEWLEPYREVDPKHRHISHVYGVAPYHEITPERTPELVRAVRATLKRRGEGGPGWSRAWKTVLYARMNDAPQALHNLRTLFGTQLMGGLMQLEANWGGAYGVTQMILQSHPESGEPGAPPVLHILPALPEAWPHGEIAGWRTRGGCAVDMAWEGGALKDLTLQPKLKRTLAVRYGEKRVDVHLEPGQTIRLSATLEQGNRD
jgi:alpha-L-fucosidase 2